MNRFIEAVKNMFRIQDLRNRVMFTLALLAVYRIGAHIPIPGINTAILDQLFSQAAGSVLGIFDLFSGGNFRRMTIFALGIMPYITSSRTSNASLKKANWAAARSPSTPAT